MRIKNGFAAIPVIFAILAIIAAAVSGYFIFKKPSIGEGCIKKVVVGGEAGITSNCETISECDFYKNPEDKDMLNECYFSIATKNGDTNVCDFVSKEWKSYCLENIAKQKETGEGLFTIVSPNSAAGPISSPLSVSGSAKAGWGIFEGQAGIVTLFDDNGNNLGRAILKVNGDWMQPEVQFTATLEFSGPKTEGGKLIFKNENPSGDPVRDRIYEVPIKFASVPAQTRKIELFYYNKTKDADSSCSRDAVLPVEREIPISMTPIQDSVNLLLKGNLSDADKLAGFETEFPLSGFSLTGANLKDGTLTLQFNDSENRSGGGSCRVMLLWSQIAKTALQFSEVKQVRFQPETLFQP